ncbi:MAG: hypothetical protein U0936_02635 [Planctomycetaceae bacterium]
MNHRQGHGLCTSPTTVRLLNFREGVDGLLHIKDMSWTRKVSHANEIPEEVGDPIGSARSRASTKTVAVSLWA